MTKDDIMRMAREAGLADPMVFYIEYERFADLVAAHKAKFPLAESYRCGYEAGVVAEREACAKVCEDRGMVKGGEVFSARIRARTKP